jgi:predicted heme/steroid binding protein
VERPLEFLSSGLQMIFTKDQLQKFGDPAKGRPMIAIMGEVYDVSAAPQYYGGLLPSIISYPC